MAAIFGVLACLFLILLKNIFSQFICIDLFNLFYYFFWKSIFVSLSFPIAFLFQIPYLSVFIFIIVLLVFAFVLISCTKNLEYWSVNISWYAFPSLHDFSHISHIFISLTEVYPYYFLFFERFPLLLMGYWEVACLISNYLETFPLSSCYWFPVWFLYGQRTYSA